MTARTRPRRAGALVAVALVATTLSATTSPSGSASVMSTPGPGQPNEVVKWNAIAEATLLAQPPNASAPQAGFVLMGMVQGAVYAAVNAIDGSGRPYLLTRTYDRKASKRAAVATAAFTVLDTLFPANHDALQAEYDASLAAVPDGHRENVGKAAGKAAADAMLAGGHDARTGSVPALPPDGPGLWEPLLRPDGSKILDPAAWVALAPTLVVDSAARFRTDGPNALTSDAYTRDFNELRAVGSTTSTVRTPEQTHVAVFWQSNGVGLWNGVARRLATDHGLGLAKSARMMAQMGLSAADASIACWQDKYYWGSWRPMAAIREADTDGNPLTEPDPEWTPLFTPAFPEHPSGHLCLSNAAARALRAYFGTDELSFYMTSSFFPGEQRPFERLSDAVAEVMDARVWGGLHFRTGDEQGAVLGREVARYVRLRFFQPTP